MALPHVFAFTVCCVVWSTILIRLALFRELSFNSWSLGVLDSIFEGLRPGSVVDLQSTRDSFAIRGNSVLLLTANGPIGVVCNPATYTLTSLRPRQFRTPMSRSIYRPSRYGAARMVFFPERATRVTPDRVKWKMGPTLLGLL